MSDHELGYVVLFREAHELVGGRATQLDRLDAKPLGEAEIVLKEFPLFLVYRMVFHRYRYHISVQALCNAPAAPDQPHGWPGWAYANHEPILSRPWPGYL